MKALNRASNRLSENKQERVPVSGMRDIMTVFNKDPAYSYRFVHDKSDSGARIYKYIRGGWEFSPTESEHGRIVVGEDSVYKTKQGDSIVRMQTGEGEYSYLMRIPKELYDEDQAAKQKDIDELEATITRTGSSTGEDFGQYGEVKITRD
jgi:hypothetical protein